MKVKEKLAIEYSEKNPNNSLYVGQWDSTIPSFIAGFEAARKMAADLFKDSWGNPKYLGYTYGQTLKMIADDVSKLGEKIVS